MKPSRLAVLASLVYASLLLAKTDPVPPCRLDDSLSPIVTQALQWGIADFTKRDVKLPFERIEVNPKGDVPANALAVYIVKDAAYSATDPKTKCIVPKSLPFGSPRGVVRTDGECLPMDLSKCSTDEKRYMQKRFEEIYSMESGDSNTGYELTGACYITNLQACVHRDYMDLLAKVGRRDAISVRGGCIADDQPPATIRCSAGALKMLLSHEAAAAKAPTLGILFVLSHELAHLAAHESSTFDGDDHVLDLSLSKEQKLKMIRRECERGESLRKRERDADTRALAIAKTHIDEISTRWPKQGSVPWLVSQAGHFSTNLARWNNDWHEGPEVTTPAVFLLRGPDGGMVVIDSEASSHIDDPIPPSGKTAAEVHAAAARFLCDLTTATGGHWDVLIQSGTTHGTLAGRLIDILSQLRPATIADDPVSQLEGKLAKMSEFVVRRHGVYLSELEGEICTMVDAPVNCQ